MHAPKTLWAVGELADSDCVDSVFKQARSRGRPIDYAIHFAAYTDFNKKWQDRYCESNVIGTRNVIKAAVREGVKRILFAGSIAALEPSPSAQPRTEASPVIGEIAYTRSKVMGEKLLFESSDRIPVIVLRIGGVFTDWCELPPLFSLIKVWSSPLTGRLIPGRGKSGFPYIHRRDLVNAVIKIIEKDHLLNRCETFFASESGCTFHDELFPLIRKLLGKPACTKPIHIPRLTAKSALYGKYAWNTLWKKNTYERAWMLDYADRPLIVDTSLTRKKLDWEPAPERSVLSRLPVLIHHFRTDNKAWYFRNIRRNEQKYEYDPDRTFHDM